jgi:hypothetical protein
MARADIIVLEQDYQKLSSAASTAPSTRQFVRAQTPTPPGMARADIIVLEQD